jgi:hypothetical protein
MQSWTNYFRQLSTKRSDAGKSHLTSGYASGKPSTFNSLTRGQINAVQAAFRAGVTPTRIARQFGLSQSDVRKALVSDMKK